MPSIYRCRAEVGDGEHVSYLGPDLSQALDSMTRHAYARYVTAEKGRWDSELKRMEWDSVSGYFPRGIWGLDTSWKNSLRSS
jgi:hypothetical protein